MGLAGWWGAKKGEWGSQLGVREMAHVSAQVTERQVSVAILLHRRWAVLMVAEHLLSFF